MKMEHGLDLWTSGCNNDWPDAVRMMTSIIDGFE